MTNFNPIRRSQIKPKAKQHKESAPWRAAKIRLNGKEMAVLRGEVYTRSGGQCESCGDGMRCPNRINWYSFQMHHLRHRSQGGSDTKENCLAVCAECHTRHHSGGLKITTYKGWRGEAS